MNLFYKYKEYLAYIFWGGITTLVNILSYWLSYNILNISNVASTFLAWIIAASVAFISNKLWVFKSHNTSWLKDVKEFFLFLGWRFISEIFELGIMYWAVDYMNMNGLIWKIATNIIVMILNYIFSKFFIFK